MISISKESDQSDSVIVINNQALITNTDDYLLAGELGNQKCKKMMSVFRGICDDLGVPLAEEKTEVPTCVLVSLGLVIDAIEMVIRIPENKLEGVNLTLL